jgi:hypothetical protein
MARDRMFTTFATRSPDGAQRNPGSFLLAPPKPLVSVLPLSQRAGRFRSPRPTDLAASAVSARLDSVTGPLCPVAAYALPVGTSHVAALHGTLNVSEMKHEKAGLYQALSFVGLCLTQLGELEGLYLSGRC